MASDITLTSDIEAAIQQMFEVREEFYRTDLREIALNDALAPLLASAEALRTLLPEITKQADAYYFAGDLSFEIDLEELYEGKALLIAWLFSNVRSLAAGGDFSSYESTLNSLADNLSDLCSHCSGWDWERGYFPAAA